MASKAQITIRVYPARGSARISYTTSGRYVSFQTTGYTRDLLQQPIQPTNSLSVFWMSVLNQVLADIMARP